MDCNCQAQNGNQHRPHDTDCSVYNMKFPKHSPWGKVDACVIVAEGIVAVATASHGGIKLDRKRNAQIPEKYRHEGGWYEEDCDWAIPAMIFRDEFLEDAERNGNNRDKMTELIEATCKNWHPDFYTEVTGVEVSAANSYMRSKIEFEEANKDSFVVAAAWGSWHDEVPIDMVGVVARKGNEEAYFLIPADEYKDRGQHGFVVDPSRHGKWVKP